MSFRHEFLETTLLLKVHPKSWSKIELFRVRFSWNNIINLK